jgi:hypothetical protein
MIDLQVADEPSPVVPVTGPAVQQQDRRTVTRVGVEQLEIGFNGVMWHRLCPDQLSCGYADQPCNR